MVINKYISFMEIKNLLYSLSLQISTQINKSHFAKIKKNVSSYMRVLL